MRPAGIGDSEVATETCRQVFGMRLQMLPSRPCLQLSSSKKALPGHDGFAVVNFSVKLRIAWGKDFFF